MTTETLIEDTRWGAAGLPALATRAADATLGHLGLDPDAWEIALLGCDDARIAVLNAEFRGKPQPTNILSWPSEERSPDVLPEPGGDPELGDLAIAYDTCAREADAAGLPFDHHVCHLIVHGVLHLLGYDHISDEDAALMERIEVEILASLGVEDPY